MLWIELLNFLFKRLLGVLGSEVDLCDIESNNLFLELSQIEGADLLALPLLGRQVGHRLAACLLPLRDVLFFLKTLWTDFNVQVLFKASSYWLKRTHFVAGEDLLV